MKTTVIATVLALIAAAVLAYRRSARRAEDEAALWAEATDPID